MKQWIVNIMLLIFFLVPGVQVCGQSYEAQQLLLNVEKLAQLKEALNGLKEGYSIIFSGYTAIKDISEGNFRLHKAFLDSLLKVSPAVRKYKRVAEVLGHQRLLLVEYKEALKKFRQSGNFTGEEFEYFESVYRKVFNESVNSLDALSLVLTNGALRMSDSERLQAVDSIFKKVQEALHFLRHFNNRALILSLQRDKEKADITSLLSLYGFIK
ncbi:TerB family tellurite resistance protein [Paraflavisolibacter sp. H34]|uniref:TerB family tellurite resistance protein n=1 Tax=Huijunlia imazamoxiresistens TaxID=3127457 RepID=UPI0030173BAF